MDLAEKNILRLQKNLQAIRKIAGLTAEELGEYIGVTKQTISNLENQKTKMTKTQYLALMMVINTLIENPDNAQLKSVVEVLLKPDADEEEEINRIIKEEKNENVQNKGVALAGTVATTAGLVMAGPIGLAVAMILATSKAISDKKM